MQEAIDRRQESMTGEESQGGADDPRLGEDVRTTVPAPPDVPSVASPEAFFSELTARADVREFLKRLADL
jgi:hypothetical protein